MSLKSTKPWVIAAPAELLAPLEPLLAARRQHQPVVVVTAAVEVVLADPAAFLPPDSEALLVVGPVRRGPRRALPGLTVADFTGREVPVGWLPAAPERLNVFARAAARIVERAGSTGPLVVLGQWEDRFLRVALRTSRWFDRHPAENRTFHWTADRISRPDMIAGLGCGPGLALYFGHGRASGWAGYHGVRAEHFAESPIEPVGALLNLCCENASRRGGSLSFAEALILRGVCGGSLAGAGKTRHEDNRLLGPALCEALSTGHTTTLAELIQAAILPVGFWRNSPYRFIGDPAIPLRGAKGANEAAAAIFAPAPGDSLPPWSDESGPSAAESAAVASTSG